MPPFRPRFGDFFSTPLFYALFWAIMYSVCMNVPYYDMLFPEHGTVMGKASFISFLYSVAMFYGFSLFKRLSSFLIPIIFISSSLIFYFSLTSGYAQNKEMFSLLLETNIHEATGVLSPVILIFASAAIVLSWLCIRTIPPHSSRKRSLVIFCLLCLCCAAAKPLLPVEIKGKHPMPFGYLSHFGHAVKQQWRMKTMIAAKKTLPEPEKYEKHSEHPLYIVLALGESLRADHLYLWL